jgi:hypothetical protein
MSFSGTRSAILAGLASLLLPDGVGNVQLAQTPPQFDVSLKIASTAFIRNNGVSYGGQVVLNGTTTLTAALHAGKACTITAANAQTLPVAATCPAGTVILFSSTVGGGSVIRQGTDEIAVGNGGSTPNVSLGSGDTLVLMSDGVSNWVAIGGSVQLGSAAAFSSSLSANGYQKLPSGLIINWGSVSITSTGAGVSNASFNLPLAFPNLFLFAVANFGGTSPPGGCGVAAQPFNKSQVEISLFTPSAQTDGINYIALGF